VFLQVWRRRGAFDPERGPIRTWILAIAHHRAVDLVRERSRQGRLLDHARDQLRYEGAAPDALTATITRGQVADLRLALDELPIAQRHAVLLAFGAGLTHVEVARRTGAPLGTVKGRLRMGQQRMAMRMSGPVG